MSDESKDCPQCGTPIPENAPDGMCPKCLLLGASTDTDPGYTSTLRLPKPAPPTVAELAEAFPQLEILELIGQGGMGYVYKARQQRLDRIVALKILPETLANDPAFAERFSREGRLLAKLNHPNIVTVHDFGVTDPLPVEDSTNETVATAAPGGGKPAAGAKTITPTHRYYYLMMEYVDGANLRQAMQAGRFTPEQALNVVPKVCDALQYAHDEGVLHRDIKPENILVDTKGRVLIADFGIAKMVDAADGKSDVTLTGEGSTLGTPHYMAPEQIEQPGTVDHRADIYSLGVVFYEMLTGELPIGRFAPPSEKTSVNAQVDQIVFRALEKERELRQQSATEIKTAIEHAGHLPPAIRQPRSNVLKTAQCFFTQPDYLQTFKARFAHPFTVAGDLILERDKLVFESYGSVMVIPLDCIGDVSVGQLEWWSHKGNISIISITMEKDGLQRTFMFRPNGPWPEPVVQSNRHCADWADAIRKGIVAAGSGPPRETPAESLPLPPAPRWIMPACIATILFGPMMGFFGAELIGSGEEHNEWLPIGLGFALLAVDLVAVLFCLVACLTFTMTRWALSRGTLHALTMPVADGAPIPGKSGMGSTTAGTAVAFGTVVLFLGVALGVPVMAVLRLGESELAGGAILMFVLAIIAGVTVWERGLPGRAWTRSASLIAGLLALPTVPFGAFFIYAMADEGGGWNPAVSEAIMVPLFILGLFMLPWAALRLHRACAAFPSPTVAPAGAPGSVNPWPKRIFWALIVIFVVPVFLFVVMLVVPYLAWQKAGPATNLQVALKKVSTSQNLVIVDLDLWTKDRRLSMTSKYTGPALSESLTNSTPRPANALIVFPTPVGKEPSVGNRLDAMMVGRKPTDYRVGFVLKDARSAALAADIIEETFEKMRAAKPHVRSQLFLFHIKGDDDTEIYASIDFKRAWRVSFREEIRPEYPPPLPVRVEKAREKLQEISRQQQRPIDMLGNLPVTVIVKSVLVTNVMEKIDHEVPAGTVPPSREIFSNRLVQAAIEIRTRPGVPAIGFNYQGAVLDPGFLGAIDRPMSHSKVEPAPGVSQLAFQIARAPQPETMLATTLLIPLPDEAAAREVLRQLKRIQQQPLSRILERDRKDKQLKLGFFNVPKTSKGAYSAWFVFAPPREPRLTPQPPRFLDQSDEPIATGATAATGQEPAGKLKNNSVPLPKAVDRAHDTPTRRTFDLRHKLAGEMKEQLRQILTAEDWSKATINQSNRALTVFGPSDTLDRVHTLVTVMDWPTDIARGANFEYPRDSVMNAMRSFFHACAIEDDYRAFNKMLSLAALNRLKGGEGLPAERSLKPGLLDTLEKDLRGTDWPGKEEAIADLIKETNKYPLKSLRQEAGVAIGFGARYFVSASFGGDRNRSVQFSISAEQPKEKHAPVRYQIDNWTVPSAPAAK